MSKKLFYILFVAIVGLALGLRCYYFAQMPAGTYWDETAILMDAKSVAQTGTDVHGLPWYQLIYPSYGDYKLAPYIWLATLAVKLGGASIFAIRLPSLLAGIGTVIVAGMIAKLLAQYINTRHNSKTIIAPKIWQLTTMLVVAISPWSIIFSRVAFEGHLAQFFLSLSVWGLIYATTKIKKHKIRYYLFLGGTGLLGGLAMWTYFSVRFVWPIIVLGWLAVFFYHSFVKKNCYNWLKNIILTLLVVLGVFAMMLYMMIKTPFYQDSNQFRLSTVSVLNSIDVDEINRQREIAGNDFLSRIIFNQKSALGVALLQNYTAHLDLDFLFVSGDSNLRHGTGVHGLFLLIFLPFLMVGLWQLWAKQKTILLFLLIWWLIALLPASVPLNVPHALRSLNALVPIAMIIGLGTAVFFTWHNKWSKYLKIGVILIMIISLYHFLWYYFNVYNDKNAFFFQANYWPLMEQVNKERHNFDQVEVASFDGRFFVWAMAGDYFDEQELEAREMQDFAVTRIANVNFAPPFLLDQTSILYVGTAEQVARIANENGADYRVVFKVADDNEVYLGVQIENEID